MEQTQALQRELQLSLGTEAHLQVCWVAEAADAHSHRRRSLLCSHEHSTSAGGVPEHISAHCGMHQLLRLQRNDIRCGFVCWVCMTGSPSWLHAVACRAWQRRRLHPCCCRCRCHCRCLHRCHLPAQGNGWQLTDFQHITKMRFMGREFICSYMFIPGKPFTALHLMR